MKRIQGFTLLEVLVSVVLFAIMASMAYAGLNHIIRSSEQIKRSNQSMADLQFALFSIENDVLQLTHRSIRDDYGDSKNALVLTKESIELSRSGWQNFLQMPRSSIQRVAYNVEDELLKRRFWLTLDRTLEQQAVSSVILNDVADIEFYLVDKSGKTHYEWPVNNNGLNTEKSETVALSYLAVVITTQQWGEISKFIELDWHE